MSDHPTAHIPRVAGTRSARHRKPDDGAGQTVDLDALIAEYRPVAGGRRHRRAAVEQDEAPSSNGGRPDEGRSGATRSGGRRNARSGKPDKARSERSRPQPTATTRTAVPGLGAATTSLPRDAASTAPIAIVRDQPAAKSRAGRNLPAAIGVGIGLGALIIASLFVYRPSFVAIIVLAVSFGIYELVTAIRTVEARLTVLPLLVGGVSMDLAAWYRGTNGLMIAFLVTVCGLLVWRLGDGAAAYRRDLSASVLVLMYLPLLAGFAVLLTHPHDGAARVLAFIGTVVCSDTGGYATGVLFGRHPLAPVVSKGKTWEGFAGSVVACCVCGSLIMMLTFHEMWWKGALFGAAIAVTATLGDLGESMIKRDLGLKDMGKLLPGHGGVMDRLDSLLPCAAVAYLVLAAYVPT